MSNANAMALAEEALQAVNDASSLSRTHYTTLMSLSAYLVIVMASTNHLQLLLDDPITLPALGIEIGLRGFYFWTPWLYLIIHAYTLLNLSLLTDKLDHFDARCEALPWPDREHLRKQLHVMAFTQYSSGRHTSGFNLILASLSWFSMTVLPIGILLFLQLDFMPAQDSGVILVQRVTIGLDVLMALYFWNSILQKRRRALLPEDWDPPYWRKRSLSGHVLFLIGAIVLYLSVFVAVIPLGAWERRLQNLDDPNYEVARFPAMEFDTPEWDDAPPTDWPDQTKAWNAQIVRAMAERTNEDHCGGLVNWIHRSCTTWWLFDRPNTYLDLRRNLIIRNAIITANELDTLTINTFRAVNQQSPLDDIDILQQVEERNLYGRSFRYADLARSVLPKAVLSGAQLQGARLIGVQLQGARLNGAQLQGADLSSAHLRGANLIGAHLYNATLTKAGLQKANLVGAELSRLIDASYAQLQGADLRKVMMSGAYLNDAHLQGANLQQAKLWSKDDPHAVTYLNRARLEGANLNQAGMQKVSMMSARLAGADARDAHFTGANLDFAELDAAYMLFTDFSGAQIPGLRLNLAFLEDVILDWDDLGRPMLPIGEPSGPADQRFHCLAYPANPTLAGQPDVTCLIPESGRIGSRDRLEAARERFITTWISNMQNVVCDRDVDSGRYILRGLLAQWSNSWLEEIRDTSPDELRRPLNKSVQGRRERDVALREFVTQLPWSDGRACDNQEEILGDPELKLWVDWVDGQSASARSDTGF